MFTCAPSRLTSAIPVPAEYEHMGGGEDDVSNGSRTSRVLESNHRRSLLPPAASSPRSHMYLEQSILAYRCPISSPLFFRLHKKSGAQERRIYSNDYSKFAYTRTHETFRAPRRLTHRALRALHRDRGANASEVLCPRGVLSLAIFFAPKPSIHPPCWCFASIVDWRRHQLPRSSLRTILRITLPLSGDWKRSLPWPPRPRYFYRLSIT
ncbi:hypothetical protein B0H10DRAFT_335611 [Mycena sp. CBHHK59/15]|nr:hypothetical protein B0H10DRAFT_335611 [Mycena sp. CBHHK59/15]